jgi:hypothetical protein
MVWATRTAGMSSASFYSLAVSQLSLFFFFWSSLGFLLLRVLKIGSDSRFDTIRAHFFEFLGTCEPPETDRTHHIVSVSAQKKKENFAF